MSKYRLFYTIIGVIFFCVIVYFVIGIYLAHDILRTDHSCGIHEGSKPNNWSTKLDYENYSILAPRERMVL